VGEQFTALGRVEGVEAMHGQELTPAWVAQPGCDGRVAAGEYDDVVGVQAGNEPGAKPTVDRGELLIAVDEQDCGGRQRRDGLAVRVVSEGEPDGCGQPIR
jgi:hypothetical protein